MRPKRCQCSRLGNVDDGYDDDTPFAQKVSDLILRSLDREGGDFQTLDAVDYQVTRGIGLNVIFPDRGTYSIWVRKETAKSGWRG